MVAERMVFNLEEAGRNQNMKAENEIEVKGNYVKVTIPWLIGSVASIVCACVFLGSQLAMFRSSLDSKVSFEQFQGWRDTLRERNSDLPLNVPPLPKSDKFSGTLEATISEPRLTAKKEN
jgi:hypothetical protein